MSRSSGATQISQADPQPRARRRKRYQDILDVKKEGGSALKDHVGPVPKVGPIPRTFELNLPSGAEPVPQNLEMNLSDGTTLYFRDARIGPTLKITPKFLKALSGISSWGRTDVHDRKRFPEHYIKLAPLPQFREFDTNAYLSCKANHKNKDSSQPKIPTYYDGFVPVEDPTALVFLFSIAEKCRFLDSCMAELFKALIPNLPKDFIKGLLDEARAEVVRSDPGQSSTRDPPLPDGQQHRELFLGGLGRYLESICDGESREFQVHGNGETRLLYLQQTLELPYWELVITLFEAAMSSKQSFGISQTIMDNAVGGCYLFIRSGLERIRLLYANGAIKEATPEAILNGIELRLRVLKKYTQAADSLRAMDSIIAITSGRKQNETEILESVPENSDQVLTFSILFIVLAIAMVPGMIGFAKATQEGTTGSTSDADFSIVIRDTIMIILAAALSAVQMIKSPRRGSAYQMAWVFSALAVSLGLTAIIVYPLANKAFSSLCGFFAQFFSIASLAILVLNGPGLTGNGTSRKAGMSGAGRTSEEKKNS